MKLWGTERWSPPSRVGKQSKQERSSYKYNIISISSILANTKLGFYGHSIFCFYKTFLNKNIFELCKLFILWH
jgi:hypothetical protein